MGDNKLKILISGDVRGKFKSLIKRVSSVNEKSGPFDYLLCVGDIFGPSDEEWNMVKSGKIQVPITTYVLGPNTEGHTLKYPDINGCELCPNLSYLGKRGVFTTSNGLRIAYVSGNTDGSSEFSFSESDVVCVRDVCLKGQTNYKGVDVLLTSSWPQDISKFHDKADENLPSGSHLLSWLSAHIKPRYHFSGLHDKHYERPPYKNESSQGDTVQHNTRFVALASVGNSSKEKWLYALSIVPMEHMRASELYQGTTDETTSPFPGLAHLPNPRGIQEKSTQYFYDMNASSDSRRGKRGRNDDGVQERKKRERPVFDQEKCWFCLSSPQVEKHLVISIGTEATLAKGGIVDDHVLILPVTHHQSTAEAPQDLLDEIERFKDALKKMCSKQKKAVVFYERNYKTSHMQIQAIPIPEKATRELREVFQDCAQAEGFELDELPEHAKLDQIAGAGVPYFYVELPNGDKLYHRIRKNFSLNFGREVLASGPILNKEGAADWRDCKQEREEECELVKRFRASFSSYDFTLE
ncbi:CWF19-like protein 1 [Frankliniella fusca]|uniref:CWF19-like protein 1 n=1 Tax=Frankliniella fusca TaxID=407009 RepID=A0AAE1H3T0_9NEOP|nr:CWF19-like protein 1 [Frankliniella fusca]